MYDPAVGRPHRVPVSWRTALLQTTRRYTHVPRQDHSCVRQVYKHQKGARTAQVIYLYHLLEWYHHHYFCTSEGELLGSG